MKNNHKQDLPNVILGIDISEDSFPFRGKMSDGVLIEVKAPKYLDNHSECISFDLLHKEGIVIHNNGYNVTLYSVNALMPDEAGILDAIPMTREEFNKILPLLTEKKGSHGFISCEELK